jgi:hypothetical protein
MVLTEIEKYDLVDVDVAWAECCRLLLERWWSREKKKLMWCDRD